MSPPQQDNFGESGSHVSRPSTHQVNFFLQVVHILLPLAFFGLLRVAICGRRQLVLLFPSLGAEQTEEKSASEGAHVAASLQISPPSEHPAKQKIPFQTFSALLAGRGSGWGFKKAISPEATSSKLEHKLVTES